jgi:hypothetical protein
MGVTRKTRDIAADGQVRIEVDGKIVPLPIHSELERSLKFLEDDID